MKLFSLIGLVLALSLTSLSASALDSCSESKACKSDAYTCHAGVCIPKASICKDDAGCASHQVCDKTCPHSGGVTSISVPIDGDSTDASNGSGGSGSSGSSGGSGSDGDDDSASSEGNSDKDASEPGTPSTGVIGEGPKCPEDVGVCVVSFNKVTTSKTCETICKALLPCDSFGSSSGSSTSPGEPLPDAPGTDAPTPTPGSDDDDDATDDDEDGAEDPKDALPEPGGSGEPVEGKDDVEADMQSCVKTCAVLELEVIATKEVKALADCITGLANQTCEMIENTCSSKNDAIEKKLDDAEEQLEVVLAGGFGASDSAVSKDSDDGDGTNASGASGLGSENSSSASNATGSAPPASGAGCTAGSTAPKGMPWLVSLLCLIGVMARRQRA
ncbi:MAG TPA: hypothetical protein DCQ06_01765 [Myxococcales bacterium]|nr:hypothetical protein [Myxococcales bacterium]HAN30301.1 hypothetical protein [Myxococcales bacterium]